MYSTCLCYCYVTNLYANLTRRDSVQPFFITQYSLKSLYNFMYFINLKQKFKADAVAEFVKTCAFR